LRYAYFNPTVVGMDDVPEATFQQLIDLCNSAHKREDLNDAGNPAISIRGGQQIQLVPNEELGIDTAFLREYVERLAQQYLDNLSGATGYDLSQVKPMMVSAWTIKQTQSDYQSLHAHDAHISGNIYIDCPELDPISQPTDGNLEIRLPVNRDVNRFVFTDTFQITPTPKKVVIFPSYLPHVVYPWKGTGFRTILAWDVKLFPKNP
jgi:Putative 2OG-Fe(II) oxygenase